MKFLNELLDPNSVRLNHMQQGVLAIIFNSPTPQLAYDNSSGAENVVKSREFLKKMGLINVSGNSVSLTDAGDEAVKAYNISDDNGELTEYGENLVADAVTDKNEWKSID